MRKLSKYMKLEVIKFKANQLNPQKLLNAVYRGTYKVIYNKKLYEKWFNIDKNY